MDKNKIHIDDFVRSRLTGAEEHERPGAWLAMRELLDKELPVQAAFNWRRLLGFATAAILATSVGVGGYRYYSNPSDGKLAANLDHKTTGVGRATGSNDTRSAQSLAKAATGTTTDHPLNHTNTSDHQSTNNQATGITATSSATGHIGSLTTATPVSGAAPHRSSGSRNHATDHTTAAARQGSGIAGTATRDRATTNRDQHLNTAEETRNAQSQVTVRTPVNQPATAPQVAQNDAGHTAAPVASLTPASGQLTGGHSTTAANNIAAAPATTPMANIPLAATNTKAVPDSKIIPASAAATELGRGNNQNQNSNNPIVPGSSETAYTKRKDTIQQIEIVHHRVMNPVTQKMQYRADTVARNKVVVERKVPISDPAYISKLTTSGSNTASAAAKPANTPAESTVNPVVQATASSVDAAAENNLVSLSKFRVSSKFRNVWNAEKFNNFVKNVNFALAKAQFYSGITGGFNTTVASVNTLAGFQLGLTGLLTFNERWSIAADLKFYQRFSNGNSITDDYAKTENFIAGGTSIVNGVENRQYTWNEDQVTHYYNFTTVQTIEAPLMLRYNFNRVFTEAGLNMMYAFRVSAEEIDRPDGKPKTVTKFLPTSIANPQEAIGAGRPQIRPEDFNARFGLGYVLGVGYQFTPAINANLRMVQNFWDNATSDGARKVSRSLYQTPSIQFSVGYRFSQNRHR